MKTCLAALLCAVCGFAQQPGPSESPRDYAREKERALGERLAAEVRRQAPVVDDPVVSGYLDRIARKLSAQCSAETPIDISLVVSDEMNGFALPGGFLFVNTGLIRKAGSEAELAGVLAQLIAFVEARGLARPAGTGRLHLAGYNYASVPLIFMGGWSGFAYGPETTQALIPIGFLSAYRAAVLGADERGLKCLSGAGYDPEAFVQNLKKLQAAEAGRGEASRTFSTHPTAAERIEKVQGLIDRLAPKPDYTINTPEFNEVKRRVELLYPQQQRRAASPPSLRR